MQNPQLAGNRPSTATQRFLDIAEIKEDTVVLNDGTMRAVILVSSINFALKSEDEQNAIIAQYVSFLNSLEWPLQIVVQSRRLNIDNYLERLRVSEQKQTNELLRVQIADYRAFVQELVSMGQIMQKQFFVVVPYNPLSDRRKSFTERLQSVFMPGTAVRLAEERFQRQRSDLMTRADRMISQLKSMGLSALTLDTQGLIELYYRVYNPDSYDSQKMQDPQKLQVTENASTI